MNIIIKNIVLRPPKRYSKLKSFIKNKEKSWVNKKFDKGTIFARYAITLFNNLIILKKNVVFIKIEPAFSFRDVLNVHNIAAISGLLPSSLKNRVPVRRNFHLRHINLSSYK